jgi:uncharacterized membrane protein
MKDGLMSYCVKEWALLLFLLVPIIVAVVVYPLMPEVVPTHWNAQGQVDGYSGRAFGTFFLPFMNIGLYILLFFAPKLDPKKDNYPSFASTYRVIRWLIHAFMVVIYAVTLRAALGHAMDVGLWIPPRLPSCLLCLLHHAPSQIQLFRRYPGSLDAGG